MPQHHLPEELLALISHLRKLPGVGSRTAERFAFELLKWPQEQLSPFAEVLRNLRENVPPCPICGCLMQKGLCRFCETSTRDTTQLCLLASARDAYAIEETKMYHGLYHVIEHLLSPLEGKYAQTLHLERITKRIALYKVREIIIAFDPTLEGDTTALFLKKQLSSPHLTISRLALGLPVGSSLEYIDEGTLSRALQGRQSF